MKQTGMEGILPVAAATFDDQGNVNYDDLKSLIEFQIKAGARGITLFGFATEFYKLSETEQILFLQTARATAGNRLSIMASVTEQSTELAVRKAKALQDNGADALMVLPPFLIPAGKGAFINHVQAVAQAVKLPVMVQYSPLETGVTIEAKALTDLMASQGNLRYLKIECKPPGPMISEVLNHKTSEMDVFVGYAGLQMIDALKRGAIGVMPGSSLTDIYCRIYQLYTSGKPEAAIALHNKLIPFLNLIFQSLEMIIKWEKVILKRRGVITSDYCRQPRYEPDRQAWPIFEDYYQELSKEFLI